MSDVFVSYKAEDRKRVRPLVEALEAEGYSVWWDEQIGGGASWRRAIESELDAARSVVVVWSKRSAGPEGTFVQDEATRAQHRHVYVPILIDKVHLPLGFGETQALPLSGWKGDRNAPQYLAVLDAVRGVLGQERRAPMKNPPVAPRFDRRTLMAGSAAVAAVAAGGWYFFRSAPAKASNSIAVMPFANLSGDPSQAYFSDGLAEELRSALSRIPELNVMARTSSEKVREDDIQTAAHKLRVANILTGSVRRSPTTIRVTTQLIDGRDGLERWSEAYDRPVGDTLNIQTDIAQKVAAALSIRLSRSSRSALAAGGTANPEAQDLVMQVKLSRDIGSRAGLERALALLDAAVRLDPNYAEAYARKASLMMAKAGTYSLTAAESYQGHRAALNVADRAIALAPRMGLGYATRGDILRQLLDMRGALADSDRSTALAGSDEDVLVFRALLLSQFGRHAEALRLSDKRVELDPLNPRSHVARGINLYFARRYPEAVASLQRALQAAPGSERARSFLGHALLMQGKSAEADAEYRKLAPDDYRRLLGQAVLAAKAGRRSQALEAVGLMTRLHADTDLYQIAEIYGQLGITDEALRNLGAAIAAYDSGASSMRVDPFLDPVRRDPRYAALERKLNFP